MKVHWLQHAGHEDLGCIAPWLAARGATVECSRLHAGDSAPPPDAYEWLIVMGGPMNIYEYEAHPWLRPEKAAIRAAIDAGRRVLGICLGAQLIADVLGGRVTRNAEREIGWFDVTLNAAGRASKFFAGFPERFSALHWHGDTFAIPPGAERLMSSEACVNQAFAIGDRVLATQFHLEVTAADARVWLEHDTPAPARYVQPGEEIVADIGRFAENNQLMLKLLDNFLAAS